MKTNSKLIVTAIVIAYAVVGFIASSIVWAMPGHEPLPMSEDTAPLSDEPVLNVQADETKAPETTTVPEVTEPNIIAEPVPILNKDDTFEPDVVTVNNSDFRVSEARLAEMQEIFDDYRFKTSFYIIDLESGASIGYNADKVHSAASTVKAGFAMYCFKQIAAGNAKYNDTMKYEEKHFIKGSGSTQDSVFGTVFTIKALLYRQLYNSDNVAHLMLVDFFGYDGYNQMMNDLGVEHTIGRASKYGDFTPQELGLIWQEIYNFKDTCEEGKLFWEYLTSNLYNEIDVALDEKYPETAHKSGWNSKGYHEAGIVMAERPYVVVVMTETGNRNNCLHRTIEFCDNLMMDFTDFTKGIVPAGESAV